MWPEDAPDDEMRHYRNPVPPLDAVTAERMLNGTLPEDDVPPDYRDVLRVLSAAAAPAASAPAAEAAALATFRSAHRPVDPPRRTSVLSKLLGAKALAAAVLGTAAVGTAAAAATGTLPDAAQAKAHRLMAAVPDAGLSGHAAARSQGAADPATAGASGHATLPGAAGLCQAYASGSGGENGGRLDSTAFGRLADAAGGADKVTAYCGKVAAATTRAEASRADAGLAGACRVWLTADGHGRTDTVPAAVVDRLTAAAGGAAAVGPFCDTLVAAPSHPAAPSHQADPPSAAPSAPSGSHGNAPSAPPVGGRGGGSAGAPSHPAPPTPQG